jgi:Tol biopolymer transport system component
MKPTKLFLLAGLLFAALFAASSENQIKDTQAEVALQAAIKTETVDGNLRSAIEQYKKIAAQPGAGRTTVATALLRMGQCYEKLGDTDTQEARKAYEQVVREYGDQAAVATEARAKLATLAGATGVSGSSALAVRRVWAQADTTGQVSSDGRFVSFTDWTSEDIVIRDLTTGQNRPLSGTGNLSGSGAGWAEYSMPSPDNKNIAYAWHSGGYNLCVVGFDGSKPRVLRATGNGVLDLLPVAWSPDGRQLLAEFVKTDNTRDMMLVAVADGSAKLLKAVGKDRSPGGVFSPDGRYIAWASKERLSLFDLQTGTESPLIPDRSNPKALGWAPDGKHILFSSERSGSTDAWLVPVAGGKAMGEPVFVKKDFGKPMGFNRTGAFYFGANNNVWDVQIAELDPSSGNLVSPPRPAFRRGNIRSPDWSPDGRWLAAVDAREPKQSVIIRSMDTGEEQEFRVGERGIGGARSGLRWTPDGKAVVVPESDYKNLIRIDVQTGQVTSLMPLPALADCSLDISRDGNVVFYVRPAAPPDVSMIRLVAHDLRSGRETVLMEKRGLFAVAVAPDGQRLLIAAWRETEGQALFVMPASGGEARELLRIGGENEVAFWGAPWWTSDGRSIAFLKGAKGKTPNQWELWRVAVEGGEPQRVGLIPARFRDARLHPDGRRLAILDAKVDFELWVMENFLPPAKILK